VKKWDNILKEEYGKDSGVTSGTCFQTSNAFCRSLHNDFGIPCKIEMVETVIGNQKAADEFGGGLKELVAKAAKAMNEKGKDNLTEKDPVLIGMGMGGEEYQFHFIMNLYENKEMVDLTLQHVKRPQWGISCNNYWAKYDKESEKKSVFFSKEIAMLSGCVLYTTRKETAGRVGIEPEKYKRAEHELRKYLNKQVIARKMPVFMR
jgi:hypothetical protein